MHQTNRFRHPCPVRHSPATPKSVKISGQARHLQMSRGACWSGACRGLRMRMVCVQFKEPCGCVGERPTLPRFPLKTRLRSPHPRPPACGSWEGPLCASERAGGPTPTRFLGSPSSRLVWGGAEKSRGEGCRPHPPPATTLRFQFRSLSLSYSYALGTRYSILGLAHILKCVCAMSASVLLCVLVLVLVPRPPWFLLLN
jgi:hypothetical protein